MAQQKTVPPIGILLVHPLHTARAGLGLLIEVEPDLAVLAQAATCEEAMAALRRLRRRSRIVLLVALAVGGDQEPFQASRAFRDEFPTIPVLACGRAVDERSCRRVSPSPCPRATPASCSHGVGSRCATASRASTPRD